MNKQTLQVDGGVPLALRVYEAEGAGLPREVPGTTA